MPIRKFLASCGRFWRIDSNFKLKSWATLFWGHFMLQSTMLDSSLQILEVMGSYNAYARASCTIRSTHVLITLRIDLRRFMEAKFGQIDGE